MTNTVPASPAYPGTAGSDERGYASRWPRGFLAYVVLQGVWIALYALLGKGFAYAGIEPFYPGDDLLQGPSSSLGWHERDHSLNQGRRILRTSSRHPGAYLTGLWVGSPGLGFAHSGGRDARYERQKWPSCVCGCGYLYSTAPTS